jgi:hypothetical protein
MFKHLPPRDQDGFDHIEGLNPRFNPGKVLLKLIVNRLDGCPESTEPADPRETWIHFM